ncbi:hypothetical protein COTS27_00467 [Spirochaetota bacterium]|nr:hypothetical protein COTS27_00467 [Spirochaetota bacterium]
MKSLSSCIFRMTVMLVFFSALSTSLGAQEQSITTLERRLLQKIEQYLGKVLPRDSFSANVAIFAETTDPAPGQSSLGDELLPGLNSFSDSLIPGEPIPIPSQPLLTNTQPAEEQGVRYRNNILLKNISVNVTIDETLPDLTISAVENAIANQLDTLYPDIVNISIIPADFSRIRADREARRNLSRTPTATPPAPAPPQVQPVQQNQPPVIISNIIPPTEPQQQQPPQQQQQPIIIEQPEPPPPDQPVIISNIIPDNNANNNPVVAPPATNQDSFFTNFIRESSLIWYGLLIFLAILFFALVLFGILMVVLRQDNRNTPAVKRIVIRDQVDKKKTELDANAAGAPLKSGGDAVNDDKTPNVLAAASAGSVDDETEQAPEVAAPRPVKRPPPKYIEEQFEFVKLFLKNPLISRSYFVNLSNEEKNKLILAFRSESARKRFGFLEENFKLDPSILDEYETEEELEEYRKKTFKDNTKNLRDYESLISLEAFDPISKLSLLSDKEVESIFSRLTVIQLVSISNYVDGKLLLSYVRNAPHQRKKELMKKLNTPTYISEDELDNIKKELNYYIDELAARIFTPKAERETLNQTILKSADDSKDIIESFKNEDPHLYERYKKYALNFKDFLEDESDAARLTLDNLDNDTIAAALSSIPYNSQQRILAGINDKRKQLIMSSIASKRGSLDEDFIKLEREKVLDTYRVYLGA